MEQRLIDLDSAWRLMTKTLALRNVHTSGSLMKNRCFHPRQKGGRIFCSPTVCIRKEERPATQMERRVTACRRRALRRKIATFQTKDKSTFSLMQFSV